jgi:alpha-tubulin suppressor-like RCC1 family protein
MGVRRGMNPDLCGLRADGSVDCRRQYADDSPLSDDAERSALAKDLAKVHDAVEIAMNEEFACVRLRKGNVQCWSYADPLSAGTEDDHDDHEGTDDYKAPLFVHGLFVPGLRGAVQIVAGGGHACARLEDGSVHCWGRNDSGELGDGTTRSSMVPVVVSGLYGATDIAAGGSHSCARRTDGALVCWGSVEQLGDGQSSMRLQPLVVKGVEHAERIFLGGSRSCARERDGAVVCWGEGHSAPFALGADATGELAAGESHRCVRLTNGTARCWGKNDKGQLGGPAIIRGSEHALVVDVPGLVGIVAISGGQNHTCVLLADATVRCWGDNLVGQLGDGRPNPLAQPIERQGPLPTLTNGPVQVSGLRGVTSISARGDLTCALLANRTVACWGAGLRAPTPVEGLHDAIGIATGAEHACAWLKDGHVECWGRNSSNELGDGTTTSRPGPGPVPELTGVTQVVAGDHFSCALRVDKTVACWGSNSFGQIGSVGLMGVDRPLPVTGLDGVVELAAGSGHVCARRADATLRCWGDDRDGQVGDGVGAYRATPVAVASPVVVGAEMVAHGVYTESNPPGERKAPTVDPDLQRTTDEIPARLGTIFGAQFRLLGTPFGEPVTVSVRISHPHMVDPEHGPTGDQTTSNEVHELGVSSDIGLAAWTFEKPWELVPGQYTFQIFLKDRLLGEQRFHVVSDASRAAGK